MNSASPNLGILVVDDDEISRALLQEHLSAANHHVLTAGDVTEAMNILNRQSVQIVIADWMMPGATGLELCEWVRLQPWGQQVHFVMLTVLSDKSKLIEAFRSGVDDFLSKPLHEGELLARLRAWVRIVSLQEQLAQRHAEVLHQNKELVALNEKLADLAIRDELTGLPNRRDAERRIQEQWAIATRYDQPLCCAVIDVDKFKKINDTFGHRAGDEVLRELAQRLTRCLREADGVFRIGGDEFLVLLPCVPIAEATLWAQRCQDLVSQDPFVVTGAELRLTISIGIAQRLPTMPDWKEIVERADQGLFAAKRARMENRGIAPSRS